MRKFYLLFLIFSATLTAFKTRATISLPAIFSDHMVLQQNTSVTLWGWGKPNEVISIQASWDPGREYSLKVENQSAWSVDIETPPAGGPYQMTLKGHNTIKINDILIGEVWLGSGQSNMEWAPHMKIDNAEEERKIANYPEIRFFTALTSTASVPQQHLAGEWVVCTPETMWNFSALMYFFGRELHQRLGIPVGLVHSSWGGTPIEVWIPEERITGDRLLHKSAQILKPVPWGPHEPGKAYNAMIHPLIPFKIKGALWYQGEANTANPEQYDRALYTLIESWRGLWGYDFSFYYAQIAPWKGYGEDNVNGAIIRDQQRKVLGMTRKTGMIVVSDIGDLDDIHPGNKQDAGRRLAAWALHHDYGIVEIPFSGPLYSSCAVEKNRIIIQFDHIDGGLVSRDGELRDFEILDNEGLWTPVKAIIDKSSVILNTGKTAHPRGIRFAYHNDSTPNLFNQAELPASCFMVLFKE